MAKKVFRSRGIIAAYRHLRRASQDQEMSTHLRKLFLFIRYRMFAAVMVSLIALIAIDVRGENAYASPHDAQESAARNLPAVMICKPGKDVWPASDFAETWRITRPTSDAITFECSQECRAIEWQACTYPAPDIDDAKGRPYQMHAFVTDMMGGELHWNLPYDESIGVHGVTAGLLLHSGGPGTSWIDEIGGLQRINEKVRSFWNSLERDGLRLVGLRWHSAARWGWLSHKDASPSTFVERTRRSGAVMRWVHDHLLPAEVRFGTLGSSAGSVAAFSAVYWHGLDPIIDYQLLGSGPAITWDINAFCTGRAVPNTGICENAPEINCDDDARCGSGKCAFPAPSKNIIARVAKAAVDYVARTDRACQNGEYREVFNASSYKFTQGDWVYDHPVDFDIATLDPTALLSFLRGATDTALSVTYTAGKIYANIQTSAKTWTVHHGARHGSGTQAPRFLGQLRPRICKGLGLSCFASIPPIPKPTGPSGTPCHLYDKSIDIPAGYAAPFNLFSTKKEPLAKANCTPTSIEVVLGNGSPSYALYSRAYLHAPAVNRWREISLTSRSSKPQDWYSGQATVTLSLPPQDRDQPLFLAFYLCTWTGSSWKCGCQEQQCASTYWNLQAIGKP
jgi:hypothetical protein